VVQDEIDGRIERIDFSEEEVLVHRAAVKYNCTPNQINETMLYEDLLKMVYFDDIEAIESHCMNKQQEIKDKILEEMTDG
jgi:hypothetical protein